MGTLANSLVWLNRVWSLSVHSPGGSTSTTSVFSLRPVEAGGAQGFSSKCSGPPPCDINPKTNKERCHAAPASLIVMPVYYGARGGWSTLSRIYKLGFCRLFLRRHLHASFLPKIPIGHSHLFTT